jgi:hypothetical protein
MADEVEPGRCRREEDGAEVRSRRRWRGAATTTKRRAAKGYLHVVTQDSELSFSRAETIAAGCKTSKLGEVRRVKMAMMMVMMRRWWWDGVVVDRMKAMEGYMARQAKRSIAEALDAGNNAERRERTGRHSPGGPPQQKALPYTLGEGREPFWTGLTWWSEAYCVSFAAGQRAGGIVKRDWGCPLGGRWGAEQGKAGKENKFKWGREEEFNERLPGVWRI